MDFMWMLCGVTFLCLGVLLFLLRKTLCMWLFVLIERLNVSCNQVPIIYIPKHDKRVLKVVYSSNEQLFQDIKESKPEVMVIVIECRKRYAEFLGMPDFYSILKKKHNIFLINVNLHKNTSHDETAFKKQLSILEKHLIIQCRTRCGNAKAYVKEPQKDSILVDLSSPAKEELTLDDLCKKLKNKNDFGVALIVDVSKLALSGKFCDNSHDCSNVTDITKIKLGKRSIFLDTSQLEADSYSYSTLIDYAVFHNDFLSTCLLSLHDWDFFAVHDNELSTLEIAAKYADVNILAVLLKVHLPISEQDIILSEAGILLLKPCNFYCKNTPLLLAAKAGKLDNVEFLIRCGLNLNHCNDLSKNAIILAWEHKRYKVVKSLIQKGVVSPVQFSVSQYQCDMNKDAAELRSFIEERNVLHNLIREGDLEKVKCFVTNDTPRLCISVQGESALLTAINYEKWDIYAFLKFKNMVFQNYEEKLLRWLSPNQLLSLEKAMIRYFPNYKNSNNIISYESDHMLS